MLHSGTRNSHTYLNCDMPRSCPLLNCQLDCSLGYQFSFFYSFKLILKANIQTIFYDTDEK